MVQQLFFFFNLFIQFQYKTFMLKVNFITTWQHSTIYLVNICDD